MSTLRVKITKASGQQMILRLSQKQLNDSATIYAARGITAEILPDDNGPATCPDCGRIMEQERGNAYCEYCEG